MSATTSAELSLLRSRPQRTKLSLSIFQPSTIFQARVNDPSISRNEYQITYDNVTFGDYTAVEAGMTLLVGSSSGARDLGKIRVRSITSSVITVAENSDVQWVDNAFLTIQRYWEVWPIYPRIIQDPADPEDTIWYKDYDILYTNQNRYLGAFPCAGPHRAAYLDNGSVDIYYTATGTHNVLDNSFDTHWWFEGATVTGSSAYTPGNITYDTPGHYTTRLTVTGSNYVDTTYRYVSIYDRPGEGSSIPLSHWEFTSIPGSRPGGGYTMDVKVWENIDIHEGDVVVIFGESWFGSTKQTVGGNADGNSDIFFVGYILRDTIQYDYRMGEVTFSVGSITEFAKEIEGFSVSVESVLNPKDWYQLYEMNIESALYHYLKWHTTILSVTDVQVPINDRPVQYFDSDRESIYDAMNSWMQGTVMGRAVSDMQGKIWAEMGAQTFPKKVGLPYRFPAMTIQKGDWVNSPRIEEISINQLSFVELGGIQFNGGVSGTYAPLISQAPGDAPGYRGKLERTQGLALASQIELNRAAGNYRANLNHPYQRIDYDIVANLRNLDIAPQTTVGLIIDAEDTPRNVYISGTYLVENIAWEYDSRNQLFHPASLSVIPLVTGSAGQKLAIPVLPDDGGFKNPPPQIPPIPPLIGGGGGTEAPKPTLHRYITPSGSDIVSGDSEYLEYTTVITSRDLSYNYTAYLFPTTVNSIPAWKVLQSGIYGFSIFQGVVDGASPPTDGFAQISVHRTADGVVLVRIGTQTLPTPIGGYNNDSMWATFTKFVRLNANEYFVVRIANETDGSIQSSTNDFLVWFERSAT